MAPGWPRRQRHSSSSSIHEPSSGVQHTDLRRQSSEPILTEFRGLPEYLYQAYERLPDFATASNRPLLIGAGSGYELEYAQFQSQAAVLATSMIHRLAISTGDTVAIYSTPNIDTPVVSAAAWLIGASVVAIPPETNAEELDFLVQRLRHLRALFITRAMLPTVMQVFAPRQPSLYRYPIVVVVDATVQVPTPPVNVTLQDLYTAQPGEAPYERNPLTRDEAQDHIAVIYNNCTRDGNGQIVDVDMVYMSHDAVINYYNNTIQRQAPSNLLQRRPLPLAYSVLRLHYAYHLHRIIFDIFSRGGNYLVASTFDPAEFVAMVHRYRLEHAELISTEIQHLIEYLITPDSTRNQTPPSGSEPDPLSIADMLSPLRYIHIETYTLEQAQSLNELLPHVVLVRARFGSYLGPSDQPRG
ncbi:hypothetical protein GGI17_001648 [Coemansia sp. S146]|nr:hypothetical protein GGI17_001648 [Coemansia sp. S146]